MKIIRVLAGLAIIALGLYAAGAVIEGLNTGEIMQLSKHGNAMLHKATAPSRFWIAIVFWSIAAIMLLGGGANMVRKNL